MSLPWSCSFVLLYVHSLVSWAPSATPSQAIACSDEEPPVMSLLQLNLQLAHEKRRENHQGSPQDCVPWGNSSTLLRRTCNPLRLSKLQSIENDTTDSLCLCRQAAPAQHVSDLIAKYQCPAEASIASSFKLLDSMNISLNSNYIASLTSGQTQNGAVRIDISDQQIDVSPARVDDWIYEFAQVLLDVAKEVRLPNISFVFSQADGSPDWSGLSYGKTKDPNDYKAARLGVWRTEGRPGVDLLSIPRSLMDWGEQVRSTLELKPDANYTPKSFAVFRGHPTGLGWRNDILKFSRQRPDLLDASTMYFDKKLDWLTDEQQMRYQAVIAPDGNSIPDRLARQLAYGIPVVFVHPLESLNEFWYPDMVPWVHYVPSSGTDLEITLQTLRDNSALAQQIGLNGKRFIEDRLTERSLRCYMYQMLDAYASRFEY